VADEPVLSTTTPWRRDPADIESRLSTWARQTFGDQVTVADVRTPEGNGMSSETMLLGVLDGDTRHDLVVRLAPPADAYPVFASYDLELQARCMRLVAEATSVPVPEVVAYEPDPALFGSPFIVMRRIDGIVPSDNPPYVFGGWLIDMSPADRAELQRASVQVLADLHQITPATHDLSFLSLAEHGAGPLDQQLGFQRWYYEWARGDSRYPIIERLISWLDERRPAEGAAVLNWGDARIGNMLYRGTQPVAVLDWEMACVGPPEVDLAWMIFLHRFFQSIADVFEMPGVDGFMERTEMAAAYTEMTGHEVEALDWYEAFAALRFATVSIRTSLRGVHYGLQEFPENPDDLIMHRALIEQMLDGSYWS
jgi:aminoglycoside phosphotransferase (APT) family kinase protein